MAEACTLATPSKPCPACPWRVTAMADDIPHFDMELAEGLASTCPDEKGHGPEFQARMFACHQSKDGAEIACAGWLATVGHKHPRVRFAVGTGRLDPASLRPGKGWPALHKSYQDVLAKLRKSVGMASPSPSK